MDDQPAPAQRHLHRVAGLPPSGPMEVVTFIDEFGPGARTPAYTHPGLTLVTVLEGAVTFTHPDREATYKVGDRFVERPGEVGVAANTGATTTRVMASMVVPKAAAPSTSQAGAATPPLAPRQVAGRAHRRSHRPRSAPRPPAGGGDPVPGGTSSLAIRARPC